MVEPAAWDESPISDFDALDAILDNELVYELGDCLPTPPRERGGRPRDYPNYLVILYDALITVYKSCRRAETEMSHPVVWGYIRARIEEKWRDRPDLWMRPEPPKRHHYQYMRETYLLDGTVSDKVMARFRERTAQQAVEEVGLFRADGPGSITHPDMSRLMHADGKVITPVYKAKPGTLELVKRTNKLRELKSDPTAELHVTGSGEQAWGNKFVLVAGRRPEVHGRMILDFARVEHSGGEAAVATAAVTRTAAFLPGAIGPLYDTALRGTHIRELMQDAGVLPICPVTALSGGRRSGKPRVERETFIETRELPSGSTIALYAHGGALGYADYDENGDAVFVPLKRVKIVRRQNRDGKFRWYGDYALPDDLGGGTLSVRLDTTEEDDARGLNRCEHLRGIPPGDPDYVDVMPRRNDIESINRSLDDTMFLERAHSVGGERQFVELLGFALYVNSIALYRARAAAPPMAA